MLVELVYLLGVGVKADYLEAFGEGLGQGQANIAQTYDANNRLILFSAFPAFYRSPFHIICLRVS